MFDVEIRWEDIICIFSYEREALRITIGLLDSIDGLDKNDAHYSCKLEGEKLATVLSLFEMVSEKKLTAGKYQFEVSEGFVLELEPHSGSCAGALIMTLGDDYHSLFTLIEQEQLLSIQEVCLGSSV